MVLRRLCACLATASALLLAGTQAAAQQPPADTTGGGAQPPTPAPAQNALVPPEVRGAGPADGARGTATEPPPASATTTDPSPTSTAPSPRAPRAVYDGLVGDRPSEVYSEDWWAHTRPIVELHGYFRTRGELFHNFSLGRHTAPGGTGADNVLWPHPLDHSYGDLNGTRRQVLLCHDPDPQGRLGECIEKSQSTANLRLRLEPEIHISDNLRVLTQIDLLDNLVLGSTPDAYAIKPGQSATGYVPAANGYNGYAPLGAFSTTQGPPTAGVNGYRNSIDVQRAWAEYLTPIGQVRFGRMPHHWGLGMLFNAGSGLDAEYQSNIDRIMFVSGIKSIDLYFGGTWDFIATGTTNASPYDVYGGQPYNNNNLSNAEQWGAFVAKRTNPEMQRLKLARNDVVLNGGLYALYRKQLIDVQAGQTPITVDTTSANNGFERRGYETFTPDIWVQLLYNKLRLEFEGASIWGSMENSPARSTLTNPLKIRQFGFAAQAEFKAVEDKLRVQFGSGWASGDPNVEGLAPSNGLCSADPAATGCRSGEGPISTFRFHPAYNVDYIFFRKILTRVEGAYYFKPGVEYDFVRNPNGQKFGGGAGIIWSRASEFVQTPGNKRDLGVELDLQVYYQSKDGSLNDDPSKMGGFYTALQYGVFFPLGGLEYLPGVQGTLAGTAPKLPDYGLSSAQTVRLILGVLF